MAYRDVKFLGVARVTQIDGSALRLKLLYEEATVQVGDLLTTSVDDSSCSCTLQAVEEVEDLLSDCDSIAEAAVIGVADEKFGQRLRAFVVLSPGATLDEQAIKELVRGQLARHKVPKDVIFLDELPRNATGKVLKRELRDYA